MRGDNEILRYLREVALKYNRCLVAVVRLGDFNEDTSLTLPITTIYSRSVFGGFVRPAHVERRLYPHSIRKGLV